MLNKKLNYCPLRYHCTTMYSTPIIPTGGDGSANIVIPPDDYRQTAEDMGKGLPH